MRTSEPIMPDRAGEAVDDRGFLASIVWGWNHFWFRPGDPTLLGLIRIYAGLVVLYVHIAYTVDLQEFFGRDAWVNLQTFKLFQNEVPYQARDWDWDDSRSLGAPKNVREAEYMVRWDGALPSLSAHPPEKEQNEAEHASNRAPNRAHVSGFEAWSLWFDVTDPFWMAVAHGTILLIMFLFTIGFCTRITSVLTWLAALSFIQRSPTTLFGMDTMMNVVLIYLMIGPSGAALSVDRLIARYAATWRALRTRASARKASGHGDGLDRLASRPLVSANFAIRCLQINLCIIYFVSGVSKLQGTAWWNGTALWGTYMNPEFAPVHNSLYMYVIRTLCENRWLWEIAMSSGVVFTLFFEIGFPFLVWNRWTRWTMVCCAVMMHTGIAVIMGLTTFSLMMMALVMSFVPPEAVQRLLEWATRGAGGLRLSYAGRARAQVRTASLVHSVDCWDQVKLVDRTAPHPEESSSHVEAEEQTADERRVQLTIENGSVLTGYPLFERLTRSIRLLWPLALATWIPGIAQLGRALVPGTEPDSPSSDSTQRRMKGEKVTS